MSTNFELIKANERTSKIPLPDNSVDIIHSSGVLHHISKNNHLKVLKEFKRILKPDRHIQIMVYNYNSIHMHLFVCYMKQVVEGK